MPPEFRKDERAAKMAEAYAMDAVDLAKKNFRINLDSSDDSVRLVEQMLGRLHESIPFQRPPPDVVWTFAKAFGSYVGETFRKNHGGEWGFVKVDGKDLPAVRCEEKDTIFWPWGRVHKRLLSGPEENVWDYYRLLATG